MPEEELAACYRELVEPASLADDRDHAGGLVADVGDPQLMPRAPPGWLEHPEDQDHARGARPDHDPQRPDQRVADERGAGDDLVGEGERQPEVEVEVHDPPGLVPEPLPDGPV